MGIFTLEDKLIKIFSLLLIAKSGAKMSTSIPCIYWCSTKPSKWHFRIRPVSFLEILIFIIAEMTPTVLLWNRLQLLSKWSSGCSCCHSCSAADSIQSRDVAMAGSCSILFELNNLFLQQYCLDIVKEQLYKKMIRPKYQRGGTRFWQYPLMLSGCGVMKVGRQRNFPCYLFLLPFWLFIV